MPQARGDKEYVLPSKGKNTEANLLHFPQEFAVDVLNMEIDYDPQLVRPRKGLDIVEQTANKAVTSVTRGDNDFAINSFLWEGVMEDPDLNFMVVQIGRYLYFIDETQIDTAQTAGLTSRLDMNNVLSGTTEGTLALLEPTRVDFCNAKGRLMVTSNQINPSIVEYDASTGDLTITELNLQVRDLFGIDDGLRVDERPTTLSDDHKYNLLNQGWYKQRRLTSGSTTVSDPIADFFTNSGASPSVYPSNADIPYLGMVESSGDLIFDAEWLRDQTFGGSPAPKGHYVVDAFNIDRLSIINDPSIGGGQGSSSGGDVDGSYTPSIDDPF